MDNYNTTSFCSNDLLAEKILKDENHFKSLLTAMIVVNICLSISATLLNGLMIFAIFKANSLKTPSYLLITSLLFTDFLFGIVCQPLFCSVNYLLLTKNADVFCNIPISLRHIFSQFSTLFGSMEIMISMLISIDRYLALRLKQNYRTIVSRKRVWIAILLAWLVVILMSILIALRIAYSTLYFVSLLFGASAMIVTAVFYGLSVATLRRYESQITTPETPSSSFDLNIYKKTARTVATVAMCFLLCASPGLVIFMVIGKTGFTTTNIWLLELFYTLYYFNATLDPIIFLTRFSDIREECGKVIKESVIFKCC